MSTTATSNEVLNPLTFRIGAIAITIALLLSVIPGTAQAGHTAGRLDCGSSGSFDVDGIGPLPSGFDAPVPWSGLFLLEGTTQTFKAFSIEGPSFPYELAAKAKYPKALLTCTLWSDGRGFPAGYWTLQGVLRP